MPSSPLISHRSCCRRVNDPIEDIKPKKGVSSSESPRLKRRGVTIFTADHIDGTDMDSIGVTSFLKYLALLNRVPAGKFNRDGGRPASLLRTRFAVLRPHPFPRFSRDSERVAGPRFKGPGR